jgi:Flp pilus assembly pilin Flp
MPPRQRSRLTDDSGQGLVEYALILALASVGMVFALLILQNSIGTTVQDAGRRIEAAAGGGQAETGTETGTADPGSPGEEGGGGKGHGHKHGNGKGNSGNGNGNGGPNGRK